jgi:hypothetical protein
MKLTITCKCGEVIDKIEFENGYDTGNFTKTCSKCKTCIDISMTVSIVDPSIVYDESED